jgi:Ribonuclease G/E
MREIHARAAAGGIRKLICRMPIENANYLNNMKRDSVTAVEKDFGIKVAVIVDSSVPPGEYVIEVEKSEVEKSE